MFLKRFGLWDWFGLKKFWGNSRLSSSYVRTNFDGNLKSIRGFIVDLVLNL